MKKSLNMHGSGRLLSMLRKVLLVLALTLLIGGVTQAAPAQAAELIDQAAAGTKLTPYMDIHMPEGPFCPNKPYYISVITRVDTDVIVKGKADHRGDEATSGIKVEAKSSDKGVATISPASLISGADPLADPGEALFTVNTLKKGTTIITFTLTYKGKPSKPELTSITVEPCAYLINMNAVDIESSGGVTIWTSGNLNVKITGDGGPMTGTGNFEFASGFTGPECSISYSEYNNPTTITGQIDDNGQLTLQFAYQPGEITENASCPGGSGSFTKAIDLTNTGVLSATFPEDGGTRAIRFTYAGSDMPPGTMTIDVEPVAEEAGA